MPASLPPLSVYVHLPWCVRKCPYCDFNSHALHGELAAAPYVAALVDDLREAAQEARGRLVETIFFGGGTPSLFPAASIAKIIDSIAAALSLPADAEITLEANPGTVERDRFSAYRSAGVNRISLGAQSFDDHQLAALGRIHRSAETMSAVDEIRNAGFDNLNLDLMYGLPGQAVTDATRDLQTALALMPEHVSHYQLTIEPNTLFASKPPRLPDHDTIWDMQQMCHGLLAAAGFEHYEVSAFASPGFYCRHNLNYWRFGDYLGIGAGAHAKLTLAEGIRREARYRDPARYMQSAAKTELQDWPDADDLVFEFMLNALRLEQGFERNLFSERTGLAGDMLDDRMSVARAAGFLHVGPERVRLTEKGRHFRNDLITLFLPETGVPGA